MPTAKVPNPRKNFQFTIIFPGLDPFQAQDVKLPDFDLDSVEHGDVNYDVKTAGRIKIGNLTISQILSATKSEKYFADWARQIQDQVTGGGELPSLYKRSCIVMELAPDGVSSLDTHIYDGCWPIKINGRELNRKGSDNTMESIELSVDVVRQ
jgi:hypothetical protein